VFIPYKDDNPRILIPYVTWGILTINILVFMWQWFSFFDEPTHAALSFGTIPALLTGYSHPVDMSFPVIPPFLTLFTSMFMHAGVAHLLGNMLFLYIFADNVESILGHRKFLVFYLACGVAATLLQVATDPHSFLPIVGASGAISGVMAAYLLKYPKARIHVLVLVFPVIIPAGFVVGIWILSQVLNGLSDINRTGGGVAWFAHIGGFLAGAILSVLISNSKFRWRA